MGLREYIFVIWGLFSITCLGALVAFGIMEDEKAHKAWKKLTHGEKQKGDGSIS